MPVKTINSIEDILVISNMGFLNSPNDKLYANELTITKVSNLKEALVELALNGKKSNLLFSCSFVHLLSGSYYIGCPQNHDLLVFTFSSAWTANTPCFVGSLTSAPWHPLYPRSLECLLGSITPAPGIYTRSLECCGKFQSPSPGSCHSPDTTS